MVYDGSSSVQSAGETVRVDQGMGTSVREGEAPQPPERLLPAPAPAGSTSTQNLNYSNPLLAWRAVDGAAGYRVEVCASAACSQVVAEARVDGTSWRPDLLPAGGLSWRVRAVSDSGLDGYASDVRRLTLGFVGDGRDLDPPALVVVAQLQGSTVGSNRLVVGPQGWLQVASHDDRSGVEEILVSWNDGDWSPLRGERIDPPGAAGVHRLALRARDRAGRESDVHRFDVERVLEAPAPSRLAEGAGVVDEGAR